MKIKLNDIKINKNILFESINQLSIFSDFYTIFLDFLGISRIFKEFKISKKHCIYTKKLDPSAEIACSPGGKGFGPSGEDLGSIPSSHNKKK